MAWNKAEQKIYWDGYRAFKAGFERTRNARETFEEIYNSNAGNVYVNGARRAYEVMKQQGVRFND